MKTKTINLKQARKYIRQLLERKKVIFYVHDLEASQGKEIKLRSTKDCDFEVVYCKRSLGRCVRKSDLNQ